jgi:hypothetical protein
MENEAEKNRRFKKKGLQEQKGKKDIKKKSQNNLKTT